MKTSKWSSQVKELSMQGGFANTSAVFMYDTFSLCSEVMELTRVKSVGAKQLNSAWCVVRGKQILTWTLDDIFCAVSLDALLREECFFIAQCQFCFSGLPNIVDFGGFSKEISMRGGCPQ